MVCTLVVGKRYTVYGKYGDKMCIAFRSAKYLGDVVGNENNVSLEVADITHTYFRSIIELPKNEIRFWAEQLNNDTYYFDPISETGC